MTLAIDEKVNTIPKQVHTQKTNKKKTKREHHEKQYQTKVASQVTGIMKKGLRDSWSKKQKTNHLSTDQEEQTRKTTPEPNEKNSNMEKHFK
jgi:hypothetical protein